MKNRITIIAALFATTIHFAQDKPAQDKAVQEKPAETKAAPKQKQAATPAPVLRDEAFVKAWKVINIECFHVTNPPNETQKKDGVTFAADGTVFYTMEGIQKTGTWSNDKARVWVNMVFDTGEKLKIKIFVLTPDQLVFTYQDPELVTTKYFCEPVKK